MILSLSLLFGIVYGLCYIVKEFKKQFNSEFCFSTIKYTQNLNKKSIKKLSLSAIKETKDQYLFKILKIKKKNMKGKIFIKCNFN